MRRKRLNKLLGLTLAAAMIGTSFIGLPSNAKAAPSEAYTWRNVVTGGGGGFVPGIIFNTKEKDLIYARTDIGGAYRWNPADKSWTPLTDFVGFEDWSKNGIDALATDPVDPNRVYMATGTYTNSWDKSNGQIMRSTDRGDTWELTKLPFKVGGNMPGRSMGERLMIDPNDNRILYFGARSGNGLWKSTDYGVTWNKVSSFPNPGTYVQDPSNEYTSDIVGLAWITFDPSSGSPGHASQTIYVGVADKNESVYRSTDGGATWAAVPGQPTGYLPHHGVLSSNGNLYISYSDGAGPYDGSKGEVWKLNTKTGAWTNISPVPANSADNHFGYGGLSLDAKNPDTLVVATLNAWWPDETIYRSKDGGATWNPIWEWNGYPSRNLKYNLDISAAPWLDFGTQPAPPEISPKLGWMIGDLEIDPHNPDRMMYGTGATIYGTNNLTNWDKGGKIDLAVAAKGIEETNVNELISPPSGAHLVSGLFDVTGFRHDDLTKSPAKMMVNPNSTTGMDYAELDPSFIVRVGTADKKKDPNAKSIGFSRDGGSNWYAGNGEPAGTAGGGRVALSADGSSILWSTSDKGVFVSKNNGNSWTASTGIPANAKIASDRVNPNKFYASIGGKFYISTNGGSTFTESAATGLPAQGDLNFKAMPGREGDIWLAGGSEDGPYGLWHSTDSGASFTKLSNVDQANVIGFGKAAPGKNYMALYTSAKIDGVRGVFRSDDAGASWVRINDDQHQYASINTAITGDPRIYGRVYLGTNGRGILYADPVNPGGGNNGGGTDPVENSTLSPVAASFDKNVDKQADIPVTLTLKGNTLVSIKNSSQELVSGNDYTLTGSTTVVLSKSYLASLPNGQTSLTFHFSAGQDAVLALTVRDTTSVSEGTLKVQAFNGSRVDSTNTLNPRIKLTNTGTEAIQLSDVKLRYYYTADSNKAQNIFFDWTSVGSANLMGTFANLSQPVTGADSYAEIGFKDAAGTLAAGQSVEIQVRISKEDWSNYSQTGDYSFDPVETSYTDRPSITGYLGGQLVWGVEP